MKIKIFLAFVLFCTNAPAKPLIYKAEKASTLDFEAFLLSHDQYFQKPNAEWDGSALESRIEKRNELKFIFDEAERAFLSASIETAFELYKKIAAFQLESDWELSERKLISHALLRLAQTTTDEKFKKDALLKAAFFDKDFEPSVNLYPPPLLKQYELIKKNHVIQSVQLPAQFRVYHRALLNGTSVELKRYALQVPPGDFRLTLLSDSHPAVTLITNAQELASIKHKPAPPLLSGFCKRPNISKNLSSQEFYGFYSSDCIIHVKGQKISYWKAENRQGAHNPQKLQSFLPPSNAWPRPVTSIPQSPPASIEYKSDVQKAPFYKSKIFWGVAGALTAFVIVKNQNDKNRDNSSSTRTHKDGL